MKAILITIIVLANVHANVQFNKTWYSFRGSDLVYMTITPEYFITGQLINYGGLQQYTSPGDTFDIYRKEIHDSVFLISTSGKMQKLIYHEVDHSLSVMADTISKKELIRFYTIETITHFLSYKKLTEQPGDTLIVLFNAITAQYNRIRALDRATKMQYTALGSLLPTAIETPEYIKMKICPLLRKDHQDEDEVKDKFINNNNVLIALDKLKKTRAL
ncbi:MAG TPA: hypothetical protein VKI61_10490 [Chitinophagaceae bacterium]|nr:hypothetical protein [Chitinophagaceae bacterium]